MAWQKILYRRQNEYADNYSGGDEQFLSELRKNQSVVRYEYWEAVRGTIILMCHFDVISLYFALFFNILHKNWPSQILDAVFLCVIIAYIFFCQILALKQLDKKNHGRTLVTLILFGYAFTPVIRTLTTSISTDTIYAVSIISAIISTIFHDYGVKGPIVSYPISMSSGLCSAIFLLSRLENNWQAFSLLVIAFALHSYASEFRLQMFAKFPQTSQLISLIFAGFSTFFMCQFSTELAIFWTFLHIFVVFICPWILVRKQSAKCTIHGPWDEAVPLKSM
ncbi:unnamed protein product [Caenorhabditis angaria]|uniref:Uncharacterized protein n=1 Tax=Caenorhabditis angaria TaxID=860376 RepID=A0A9P1IMF2_9PELO|nr:unnamed protein product [Caenorhabditis angaria]